MALRVDYATYGKRFCQMGEKSSLSQHGVIIDRFKMQVHKVGERGLSLRRKPVQTLAIT
jgi:hypothetical protein